MLATHSVGALATATTRVMYSWRYNIAYNMADFFSVSRDGEKERDSIMPVEKGCVRVWEQDSFNGWQVVLCLWISCSKYPRTIHGTVSLSQWSTSESPLLSLSLWPTLSNLPHLYTARCFEAMHYMTLDTYQYISNVTNYSTLFNHHRMRILSNNFHCS